MAAVPGKTHSSFCLSSVRLCAPLCSNSPFGLRRSLPQESRKVEQRRAEDALRELSRTIIGCAIKVHTALGPGLLESVYETCLCHELSKVGLPFRRQAPIAVEYDGFSLECGFRADLLVDDLAIVEIKSVDALNSIHDSQLLTYLRLARLPLGLLINFNTR